MTEDDLVKMYESTTWAERAINDFLCEAEQLGDAKQLATETLRFGGCFCPFL